VRQQHKPPLRGCYFAVAEFEVPHRRPLATPNSPPPLKASFITPAGTSWGGPAYRSLEDVLAHGWQPISVSDGRNARVWTCVRDVSDAVDAIIFPTVVYLDMAWAWTAEEALRRWNVNWRFEGARGAFHLPIPPHSAEDSEDHCGPGLHAPAGELLEFVKAWVIHAGIDLPISREGQRVELRFDPRSVKLRQEVAATGKQ